MQLNNERELRRAYRRVITWHNMRSQGTRDEWSGAGVSFPDTCTSRPTPPATPVLTVKFISPPPSDWVKASFGFKTYPCRWDLQGIEFQQKYGNTPEDAEPRTGYPRTHGGVCSFRPFIYIP